MTDLCTIGEMAHDDRRDRLGMAMAKADVCLHVRELCMWIFNVTRGGRDDVSPLTKTYLELSLKPWGLCIERKDNPKASKAAAKRIVDKAVGFGLITKQENLYGSGGQRANDYRIDWSGIQNLLNNAPQQKTETETETTAVCRSAVASGFEGDAQRHGGSAQRDRGDAQRHGGSAQRHPIGTPLLTPLPTPPAPDPVLQTSASHDRDTREPGPDPSPQEFLISIPGIEAQSWPELVEASKRELTAKPLDMVRQGYAFGFFDDDRLKNPKAIRHWMAEQLSLNNPILPGNEAYLILAMAAGLDAAYKPANEIRKTRSAYFANTVSKQIWRRVLPKIERSIKLLWPTPVITESAYSNPSSDADVADPADDPSVAVSSFRAMREAAGI